MNKRNASTWLFFFVFLFGFFLLFTGCEALMGPEGPAGPAGAAGADGTAGADGVPGPSVYLRDADGFRYYSGGEIYLGYSDSGNPDTVTALEMVNETAAALTLTASPVIAEVLEFLEYKTGDMIFNDPGSFVSYLTLDQSALVQNETITAGSSSESFSFNLNWNSGGSDILVRRRYTLELSDGTEDFNFVFEVYGFAVSSTGF